jgi:hypothetical protein
MMNGLVVALALSASAQMPLDQMRTLNAPSPVQGAPNLSSSTGVASFDAVGAFEPPPAAVPPPPNPALQSPPPGALAVAPGGTPAPAAAPCAPSDASVRADWMLPGCCGACWLDSDTCCARFLKAYYDAFNPSGDSPDSPPAERRALPESWPSPPFPGHEFQGYPLVGVPPSSNSGYPLMKALQGTWLGDWLTSNKIDIYGWVTGEYNYSTSQHTNQPDSYWIVPNRAEIDQFVLRFERQADMVQTDHIDWGFRFTNLYGMDYRYLTAGGYFSQQALQENLLYGYDPTEAYGEVYIPWVAQGMVIRVGRWIACPDIETQFAPDNYMGSHSLLFTYDTYTQSGIMLTFCLSEQWMFQCAITAGTDMAPWYPGATPTGFFGLRWASKDNRDSIYTCLNNINNAKFRTFEEYGELVGHDNFNYIVSTWTHKFTDSGSIHTNTEAYYMWQFDAHVGGTSSVAPVDSFGGGGLGAAIPGDAAAYGVLNYTEFQLSKKSYLSVRNEVWEDQKGERTGFANLYSSHAVGISYNVNDLWQVRPEVGYYRGYYQRAFDDANAMGEWVVGMDTTLRF